MKGIVIIEGQSIEYLELPLAPLPQQWARIRVESTGLCGTDVTKLTNYVLSKNHTRILGHEFIGQVIEINGYSNKISKEDWIICLPIIGCGNCDACICHKENLCIRAEAIGRTIQGSFAEFVNVPLENLIKIPTEKPHDSYILSDPLAVCLHAINLVERTSYNANSLVIGDGVIGCLITWLLLKRGRRVSIKGIHIENMQLVRKLGAHVLSTNVQTKFYDEVYETVGRCQSQTLDDSLRAVKAGGSIVVLGVYTSGYNYALAVRELFIKEVSLMGANAYTQEEFRKAVKLIDHHKEELAMFISHRFPLSQFMDALETAKNKKGLTIKILLKPGG